MYNKGEVWFVEFPLEENNRPVKITKHSPRKEDPYDTPIIYWQEANLRLASTARVSKVFLLSQDSFIFKIGDLHQDDLDRVEEMYQKYLEKNNL